MAAIGAAQPEKIQEAIIAKFGAPDSPYQVTCTCKKTLKLTS